MQQSSPRRIVLRLPGHAAHARPAATVTAATEDGVGTLLDTCPFLLLHLLFAARTLWPFGSFIGPSLEMTLTSGSNGTHDQYGELGLPEHAAEQLLLLMPQRSGGWDSAQRGSH